MKQLSYLLSRLLIKAKSTVLTRLQQRTMSLNQPSLTDSLASLRDAIATLI
jgi:hypothetical protein